MIGYFIGASLFAYGVIAHFKEALEVGLITVIFICSAGLSVIIQKGINDILEALKK